MKIVLSTSFILISSVSHADIIKCSFTEPFISTTYSTTQSTLTYQNHIEKQTRVLKNVSFQIKAAGVFELMDKKGKVMQTLHLTYKGSNGMSDDIFPFEVKDTVLEKSGNHGLGGCYSNFLKIKQQ